MCEPMKHEIKYARHIFMSREIRLTEISKNISVQPKYHTFRTKSTFIFGVLLCYYFCARISVLRKASLTQLKFRQAVWNIRRIFWHSRL